MANSHPGSYCGQDAYNDMFVTEKRNDLLHRKRTIRPVEAQSESRSIELSARSTGCYEGGQDEMDTIVRRLTEMECERLQGFPDNWTLIGEPRENPKTGEIEYWYTDINGKQKKVSASARYKALGNSIALPYWQYLARRIVAQYEHEVTIGSLFSGIGGFELVFARSGAKPLWASEIESYPIAVTTQHFGDEDRGIEGDYRNYL